MSEDLVDGVMNILTSTTTLIQRCKDLMVSVTTNCWYYTSFSLLFLGAFSL